MLLGLWFGWAAVERWRSADLAIKVVGGQWRFHANPGRAVVLRVDQVRGVGPVQTVQGPARWMLGAATFNVLTCLPEGVRASSVTVGDRYVVGDLSEIRDRLSARLR